MDFGDYTAGSSRQWRGTRADGIMASKGCAFRPKGRKGVVAGAAAPGIPPSRRIPAVLAIAAPGGLPGAEPGGARLSLDHKRAMKCKICPGRGTSNR